MRSELSPEERVGNDGAETLQEEKPSEWLTAGSLRATLRARSYLIPGGAAGKVSLENWPKRFV